MSSSRSIVAGIMLAGQPLASGRPASSLHNANNRRAHSRSGLNPWRVASATVLLVIALLSAWAWSGRSTDTPAADTSSSVTVAAAAAVFGYPITLTLQDPAAQRAVLRQP
jgi:hypothetical protein